MRKIATTLDRYCQSIDARTHSHHSWEHCYKHFRQPASNLDADALHLGFFLASWGMYRSGFIRDHDYTIHKEVVLTLRSCAFRTLWNRGFDFGASEDHEPIAETILDAAKSVRDAYARYAPNGYEGVSDTLVTKVLLGVLGCVPACDRYFVRGFRQQKFRYSAVNLNFIDEVFRFCRANLQTLQAEQTELEQRFGLRYPLMKLVDMHFHQIGRDLDRKRNKDKKKKKNTKKKATATRRNVQSLPDYLDYGLDVVFCGTAVGERSAAEGHYYSQPGNLFWSTLHRVGLTPIQLLPRHDVTITAYGLGLTDLIKGHVGNDADLDKTMYDIERLKDKILGCAPRFIAFLGKNAAANYSGSDTSNVPYGLQQLAIGQTQVFVLPSTSGKARRHWNEEAWHELVHLIRTRN